MGSMRLILVRHGRAGRRDQWRGPDSARPLDTRGRRQAERLVGVLAPLHPTRIVASPYRRCLDTMGPLAAHLDLEIERTPALAPDAPVVALSLVRELSAPSQPSGVVVCTHGEVIGAVLSEMATEDGVELERRPPGLKGCVWLLDVKRGKLVDARYLPPR
jgi:broad specificity phosphatase PhoE